MEPDKILTKTCSICGMIKHLINFKKRLTSKDGRANQCKVCTNKRRQESFYIKRNLINEFKATKEKQTRELISGIRTCSACGVIKGLNDFAKRLDCTGGRTGRCKSCINKAAAVNAQKKRDLAKEMKNSLETIICNDCGLEKPLSEYRIDNGSKKCKACTKAVAIKRKKRKMEQSKEEDKTMNQETILEVPNQEDFNIFQNYNLNNILL